MAQSGMELVSQESAGAGTTVTLDSPATRNALSTALLTQLREALARALDDPGCRVVVLTGAERAFCAGADLKESRDGRAGRVAAPELFPEILQLIWDSAKPVVCRVNGSARAGGIGLIAACDIAVPCLRRMSPRAAAEYFLTGEPFDAQRAVEVGLITAAVPKIQLDEEVARYADLLLHGAPGALAVTKTVLREANSMPVADELARMAEISAARFASEEAQEGMAAFAGKREPSWAARRVEETP